MRILVLVSLAGSLALTLALMAGQLVTSSAFLFDSQEIRSQAESLRRTAQKTVDRCQEKYTLEELDSNSNYQEAKRILEQK